MTARDTVLILLTVFLWGFNFVTAIFSLEYFPPVLLAALRYFSAAFPAVFFVSPRSIPARLFFLYSVFFCLPYFPILFSGIHMGMPAGLTSLVLQSQALFTVFFAAVLLKDRPTRSQLAGILLAFSGIVLIGWEFDAGPSFTGFLLIIVGSCIWASSNIMLRQYGRQVNMMALMVWTGLVPIIPLFCLSLLTEEGQAALFTSPADPTGKALAIAGVIFLGTGGTTFGFGIWGSLLRRYSPNIVAPFSLLVPVFGMFFSALILGEEYTITKLIASVLVFAGLALSLRKPRHPAASSLKTKP